MRTLRAVAAALALAGCAGPAVQRPAHGSYDAAFRLEVWQRAVTTLGAHGYELSFEDPALGVLLTRERESQAPCGETTCLSRETVYVRLDAGHLFVNVARTLWDTTRRGWAAATDARAIDAIEDTQAALVKEISERGADLRQSRKGEACYAARDCEKGLACVRRRCGAAAR